jgi:hypothetical protein
MKNLIPLFLSLVVTLPHTTSAQAAPLSRSESEARMNEVLHAAMRIVKEEKSKPAFEDKLKRLGAVITADEKPDQKLAFVKLPTPEDLPRLAYHCIVYRIEPDEKVKFLKAEMINIDLRKARADRNTPP